MAKDKYEISLWEDFEVPAAGNIPAYYDERKVAVIGSDTMTAPCRALEPKLVENINGTNTFTFKMLYLYNITDIEEARARGTIENDLTWIKDDKEKNCYRNPFQSLLVNERKVKLHWKDKWYDFVIKNIQEDSSGRSVTYTCKDLFVNELSKTGFDLVFDNELENNQGTAPELVEKVLEGSDWRLARDSDIIRQEKEEPVYAVTLINKLTNVKNQTTGATSITISSGKTILIYYQQVQDFITNGTSPSSVQFAYVDGEYKRDNNSQLVINADCYIKDNVTFSLNGDIVTISSVGSFNRTSISENYRASRLVESPLCKLDPLTGEYCYVYKASAKASGKYNANDEIYMYRSTKYKDATFVNNLIVNGTNFVNTEGWYTSNNDNVPVVTLYPQYDGSISWSPTTYLFLKGNIQYTNYGIRQTSNFIPNGFKNGEKYIYRFKAKNKNGTNPGVYSNTLKITPKIIDKKNVGYFKVTSGPTYSSSTHWTEYELTCIKSATRTEIYNNEITLQLITNADLFLESLEFFPYVEGNNRTRINPGEYDIESVAQVYYSYYNHTASQSLTNAADINYLYEGTGLWNNAQLVQEFNPNFEKIRSISAKQSNRFNILQSIAETFECWIKFTISHESNGKTQIVDGKAQKYISVKKDIGQETGIGFIYGIDLKTISRSIKSDQIVTKTIVPQNSNEFGKNGFCTIARSEQNYPRTNFVLNFDYYITQGLINSGNLNKDLYLSVQDPDSSSEIVDGYYFCLNKWNTQYDSNIEWISNKKTELDKQKSYQTVYQDTLIALQQQQTAIKSELIAIANAKTWSEAATFLKKNKDDDRIKSRQAALKSVEKQIDLYKNGYLPSIISSIAKLEKAISDKEEAQKTLTTYIKNKHLAFYKKYSRFLQEGTWTDESYIDDNLFYLDAQSVAYTSSRPQIEYNISVIRLSALEEYKNKVFKLGDIGFIQDTEFFGYENINGVRTPYKEMILVSEITSFLDEPEKDSFKIQNYKTQFEDLFQRITSTTQSLQYASGSYAKVASTITEEGDIKPETLQSSIAINEQLVISAKNETVYSDGTGLTVADTTNPNNKTKMTSGGVFITSDGGVTWKSAIRSGGVSTENLAAGAISTGTINVIDGNHATFRWDSHGINAFSQQISNNITSIDMSKFVRYDHYGIYGINGDSEFSPDKETNNKVGEELIWDTADFGMTWHGFFLKNKDVDGSVQITSDNDIQVISNDIERVKIGRLFGSSETGYEPKTESTPQQGTVYYIKNGPWYDKANLTLFKSNVVYAILNYSLADLFKRESLIIGNNALQEFLPNVDYYELYNDEEEEGEEEYVLTLDTEPDPEKTYYYLGEFNPRKTYYVKIEDQYIAIDNTSTPSYDINYYIFSPTSGIDYYQLQDNSFVKTMPEETLALSTEYYELSITGVDYRIDQPLDNIQYYKRDTGATDNSWSYVPTTDNDFTVGFLVGTPQHPAPTYYKKTSNTAYGIRISNASGEPVMETNSDGTLWLKKALYILNSDDVRYNISLGFLDNIKATYERKTHLDHFEDGVIYYEFINEEYVQTTDQTPDPDKVYYIRTSAVHEIFNSSNNFIVYEDGSIIANNGIFSGTLEAATGNFSGTISASSGYIGPIQITNEGLLVKNGHITIINDGLDIYGSGIIVAGTGGVDNFKFSYAEVGELTSFNDGVHYYYLENGQYVYESSQIPQTGVSYWIEAQTYFTDAAGTQLVDQTETPNPVSETTYYIYTDYATRKLYYDVDTNELVVNGTIHADNGYFKGELQAATGTFSGTLSGVDGDFSGTLYAKDGNIGGFLIAENQLVSTDTNRSIQLNGTDGSIIANNITLGTGATIARYIQLGENVRLQNSDISENQNKYLVITDYIYVPYNPQPVEQFDPELEYYELNSATGRYEITTDLAPNGIDIYYQRTNDKQERISFTNNAVINLNRIILNGNNSTISGGDSTTQYYFNITPEQASFYNISASGKISTVVFEQNHTQAVGGSMVFKPSFKIESYEIIGNPPEGDNEDNREVKLIFSSDQNVAPYVPYGVNENYYIDIVYLNGEKTVTPIVAYNPINGDISNELRIYLRDLDSTTNLNFVIILGTLNDLIVSVNSNNSENSYLRARGITIAQFDQENEEFVYRVKAFLGDLDAAHLLEGSHGFGLYTENAFLTGSLTTRVRRRDQSIQTYAGVNTLTGTNATKFDGTHGEKRDTSSIVFWAGSDGENDENIQQSPFQVTENGSLYAAQGYFEGAIITKSEIRGADIYAARIHGTGQESENNYGLAFYNMANGIVFKTGANDEEIDYVEYDPQPTESFDLSSEYWYNQDEHWLRVDLNTVPVPTPVEGITYYYRQFLASDVFWIGQEGLGLNNNNIYNYFVHITEADSTKVIDFTGRRFSSTVDNTTLYMQGKSIGLQINNESSSLVPERILFRENDSIYGFFFQVLENEQFKNYLEINGSTKEVKSYAYSTYVEENFSLHDKLQYQPVISNNAYIGYDLYVK